MRFDLFGKLCTLAVGLLDSSVVLQITVNYMKSERKSERKSELLVSGFTAWPQLRT